MITAPQIALEAAAEFVIGNLDEDGYLSGSEKELALALAAGSSSASGS